MKSYLLLVLLLCSAGLFAQKNTLHWGLQLNIGASDNFLSRDKTVSEDVARFFREYEKPTSAYGASIQAQYGLTDKLKLHAGLGYVHSGYVIPKHAIVYEFPKAGLPVYSKGDYVYEDISVPVSLRYDLGSGKNRFYVVGGFTPFFKLNRYQLITLWYETAPKQTERIEENESDAFREFNVDGMAGFGYELGLGEKLRLYFQPDFTWNLMNTNTSGGIYRKLYRMGLSVGMWLD